MYIIIKFYTSTYSLGVETLWNFMREMNVAADAELEAKVHLILVHSTISVSFRGGEALGFPPPSDQFPPP